MLTWTSSRRPGVSISVEFDRFDYFAGTRAQYRYFLRVDDEVVFSSTDLRTSGDCDHVAALRGLQGFLTRWFEFLDEPAIELEPSTDFRQLFPRALARVLDWQTVLPEMFADLHPGHNEQNYDRDGRDRSELRSIDADYAALLGPEPVADHVGPGSGFSWMMSESGA